MSKLECGESFSLHGNVQFLLQGKGLLYDYMLYQYQYFQQGRQVGDLESTRVVVNCSLSKKVHGDTVLNNGGESYAANFEKDIFIWQVGNDQASLDGMLPLGEQNLINFSSGFNKMKANLFCELLWRIRFSSERVVLVHAAAVTNGDKTILMSGWKGMGKTAACLKLLEFGCDFMGDDRVWLSASGKILAFPRYVVIKSSNAMFFPEVLSFWARVKTCILGWLSNISMISQKGLFNKLKQKFFPPIYFKVEELYPNTTVVNTANLTHVLSIEKNSVAEMVIQKKEAEALADSIFHVGNVEWNYPLLNITAAHDVLFPNGPSWTRELESLMEKEKVVIRQAISNAKTTSTVFIPTDEKYVSWVDFNSKVFEL